MSAVRPRTTVLLAGGVGSRLAPLTAVIPKPLVPIDARQSILEVVLRQLSHHGFERANISIGYLTFDWGSGRWLDIGRHEDFALAQESFADERATYMPWETANT